MVNSDFTYPPLLDAPDACKDETLNGIVATVYDAEYWTRLWIVPELKLARKILICWGSEVFSWEEISELLDYFDVLSKQSSQKGISSSFGHLYKLNDRSRPRETLEHLLTDYQNSICQDPHDYVFAFIGLATDKDIDIINIDYEVRLEELFWKVLSFCRTKQPIGFGMTLVSAFRLDARALIDSASDKTCKFALHAAIYGRLGETCADSHAFRAGQLSSSSQEELKIFKIDSTSYQKKGHKDDIRLDAVPLSRSRKPQSGDIMYCFPHSRKATHGLYFVGSDQHVYPHQQNILDANIVGFGGYSGNPHKCYITQSNIEAMRSFETSEFERQILDDDSSKAIVTASPKGFAWLVVASRGLPTPTRGLSRIVSTQFDVQGSVIAIPSHE